ncbi:MAG: restriction endonuclease subunit S [Gemmatimonadetes bacterium]|nr:restriction endonuclease subunit S [Gemmatimonadota bacterium]MYG84382.1 restriction endonuclease subunit S [Gemmatimonadota bacterium]MYJ88257.1 restriction endonuclease subunit S [Gemmatimonadota bacterium]
MNTKPETVGNALSDLFPELPANTYSHAAPAVMHRTQADRSDEVPSGYKQTEVGVIPSAWDVMRIGELFKSTAGGDLVSQRSSDVQSDSHPYPIFANGVSQEGLYGFSDYTENQPGSITITARGSLGVAFYRNTSFVAIGRLLVLKPKIRMDSRYFSNYINHGVRFAVESTGVPQLTAPQVARYSVPVPPEPEQRAIAEVLSDINKLLKAQEVLIAKKRALKHAVMQRLLTGECRLPGFNETWQTKQLGELIHLEPAGIYGVARQSEQLIGMPFATTTHINLNDSWNNKEMGIRYFTEQQVARFSPKEGDLIVVKSSGSAASIQTGKVGYVSAGIAGTFIFSNFLMLLRPTNCDARFLYYQLVSSRIKKNLPYLVEASTYPNLRISDYLELQVPLPSNEEQLAIVNVLSDMDDEITALEHRRDKTLLVKQNMMQQLLTGRIRLVELERTADA